MSNNVLYVKKKKEKRSKKKKMKIYKYIFILYICSQNLDKSLHFGLFFWGTIFTDENPKSIVILFIF